MTVQPNALHFDTWNSNVNMYVPDAQFSADVDYATGQFRVDYGVLQAASATAILSGQSMAAAGNTQVFLNNRNVLGPYGRQLAFVGPASAASVITIQGRDYMGQPIRETVTLNGVTPVNTVKFYRSLEIISWTANAASTAVNVGTTNTHGLPYRTLDVQLWLEDGVKASAGTLVAPASNVTPQTATSTDPRGGITFAAAANGIRSYAIVGIADMTELYGVAHYAG